ncbi:hypothetical protein IAT40_003816 [Kwoniella sp. CBS 6097]
MRSVNEHSMLNAFQDQTRLRPSAYNLEDKLVGNPSGLQTADDLNLLMLQVDIDTWKHQLPTTWPYSIKLVLRQAPLLMNLFIVVLEFTFQRSFMWPTTPIPSQLTFRPSRDRWVSLCQRAEQAVYWFNTLDGSFYLDIWSNTVYAAFQVGLTAQPLGDVHELFANTIMGSSNELDMDPQLSFLEQLGLQEFGFGP